MTISKKQMCHLLYCLNWHVKYTKSAIGRDSSLSEQEREVLRGRVATLTALKGKVLAKLVHDGYAEIRGVQTDIWVKPPVRHYIIRLNNDFSFHMPVKAFEEHLNEQEKTGDNTSDPG